MYDDKEPYQREENKGWFTTTPARPPIVVLLGSTRFKKHFELLNRDETLDGKIVLMPGHFTHSEAPGEGAPGDKEAYFGTEQAAALDELYRRKIELADEVLVVNPGNYVGDSTRREIAYALELKKPVRWLENPNNLPVKPQQCEA